VYALLNLGSSSVVLVLGGYKFLSSCECVHYPRDGAQGHLLYRTEGGSTLYSFIILGLNYT
jgi:hypothetical protein